MVTKIDSIEAVQRRTARWIKFNYFLTSPCDKHVKVFYSAQTWLQTYRQQAYLHVQNSFWPGCYPRSGLPYRAFRKFWYSRPLCYWLIKATTDYYKFFYFSMKKTAIATAFPWYPICPYTRAVQCGHCLHWTCISLVSMLALFLYFKSNFNTRFFLLFISKYRLLLLFLFKTFWYFNSLQSHANVYVRVWHDWQID